MPARSRAAPPLGDADALRDHLEDALDHWFSGTRSWSPATDVVRRPGELLVLADVPGLNSQDLRIAVEDAALTIAGARDDLDAGKGASYLRGERSTRRGSKPSSRTACSSSPPLPAESDPEPVPITPGE
jgi:HSP20 family molecular chaperone IbpA